MDWIDTNSRLLTREQAEDPYLYFDDLFKFAHYPQLQGILWEWMKVTVSSSFHKLTRQERANLVFVFDKFDRLLEAVHLLYEHKKRRKRPLKAPAKKRTPRKKK